MVKHAVTSTLALVCCWCVSGSGTCLDDAVPEGSLKDLVDGGNPYPIGVWVNDWAAGHLIATMATVIIKEKLGFNVELKGPGPLALDGFYALTGCTSPTDSADRGCGSGAKTLVHINLEVWTSTYLEGWNQIQADYPNMAPKNLGNSGYYGATAQYIAAAVQERGYATEGLHLDFYRDYNASRENPGRYFTSPHELNVSRLRPCNETGLMISEVMNNYAELTGDWDGVTGTAPNVIGKCFDTYFWYAPGCRAQPSRCLTWFTGGAGWGMWEVLAKAAIYNMPLATAVASSFGEWGTLPLSDNMNFLMYWWVPDPTFLRLAPTRVGFPEHNADEWARNDRRSASRDSSIDKHVSQDLKAIAPEVEEFIDRLSLSIQQVNDMLLDQLETEGSNLEVVCKWLRANEASWTSWVPENGKCYSQFGMYNEQTQQFLLERSSSVVISCRACPSGFFSSELKDRGTTHVCRPCESGYFQPSGASVTCKPCPAGSYQNQPASLSCQRCPVGSYQDQEGSSSCHQCPLGATTGLLGSVSIADCGCEAGTLNMGENGTFRCVPCGDGLDCPLASTLEALKFGVSDNAPRLQKGYYSTMEEPLTTLRCRPEDWCPGGKPETCSYGLVGTLCAVCPEGKSRSLTSDKCEDCGATVVAWLIGVPMALLVPILAYYISNLEVLAQASPLKSGVMVLGVGASAMQSIAVIGLMSARWASSFESTSSGLSIMLLDLDGLSVSCVSGSDSLRLYVMSLVIFPIAVLWLFLFCGLSVLLAKLLASSKCCYGCCKKFKAWRVPFTINTAGLGLQLGYGTMAAVAMKPLMCYKHPDGAESMISFPNLFCGTWDHFWMQVAGVSFFAIFVVGFFVLCSYAAWNMPQWCAENQKNRVQSFRFFLANFRFDKHWFVLLLLLRGFGFAMSIVVGTNTPPAQTSLASLVLIIYGLLQALTLPWKVPVINLADMVVNAALLLLVNKSIQTDVGMEERFAEVLSVCILVFIVVTILLAAILSAIALLLKLVGINWNLILQLGRSSQPEGIAAALKDCAEELSKVEESELSHKIGSTNAYDVQTLTKCIDLLSEILAKPSLSNHLSSRSRINPSVLNNTGKALKAVEPNLSKPPVQELVEPEDTNHSKEADPLASLNWEAVPQEHPAKMIKMDL